MTDFIQWWADHWPVIPVLIILGTRVDISRTVEWFSVDVRFLIFEFAYSRRRELQGEAP